MKEARGRKLKAGDLLWGSPRATGLGGATAPSGKADVCSRKKKQNITKTRRQRCLWHECVSNVNVLSASPAGAGAGGGVRTEKPENDRRQQKFRSISSFW